MDKKTSIPLAVGVSIILAMTGWLVNAQSTRDKTQDEAIKDTSVKAEKKVDNSTMQMLLIQQGKQFDRLFEEIKDLRKEQMELLKKKPDGD